MMADDENDISDLQNTSLQLKGSSAMSDIYAPVTDPHLGSDAFTKNPQTSARERRRALFILLCGTFCLGLGQTVLFTILPPIARLIGMEDIMVGAIFTVSAIFWVGCSPFWGRMSDRIGRKPVLLVGIGMFSVSILGLAITLEIGLAGGVSAFVVFACLTGVRSLHGSFSSAGPAAAQAYVADRSDRKNRASSLAGIAASFGLGATLGPGLASATAGIGPVVALYLVAAFAALAFFGIWKYLPERSKPVQRVGQPDLKITDPRIRKPLVYGIVGGVILVVPLQLFGFYLIDILALDPETASQYLGIAFMMSSMAALVSQLVIIQHFKIPTSTLLRLAPAILFVAHLLIVFGRDLGTLVFALALSGLGAGMYRPCYNAHMSLSVDAHEQGAVAGITNSAFTVGYIVAPIAAFSLYKLSPQIPFIGTSLLSCALTVYAHLFLTDKYETEIS